MFSRFAELVTTINVQQQIWKCHQVQTGEQFYCGEVFGGCDDCEKVEMSNDQNTHKSCFNRCNLSCGILNLVSPFWSEFERVEHILNRHKCYANILFNLAPQEWQEAKEAEILKAKEARKEPSTKPEETADSKSKLFSLVLITLSMLYMSSFCFSSSNEVIL